MYIYIYLIEGNRHFLSTSLFVNPFEFEYPLGDGISENDNIYVGLTSTPLSRRLTMHLSDKSSIAQHLKKIIANYKITENSYWKHNNIRTLE